MLPASRSVCRSCNLRTQLQEQGRCFSTSTRQANIPPEAPNYVDVPLSHQPDSSLRHRPKGVLPVPRELFPAKRPDKPSRKYIQNVTRDPLPKNVRPLDGMSELLKYKARMTELRKQNLREGLTELHNRKKTMSAAIAQTSMNKQKERARLITQAEREDARLTNASIPKEMMDGNVVRFSKEEADEIIRRKAANVEEHSKKKADHRRNALHTLYMNARTFITTEAQLQAEIEKEFDEKWSPSTNSLNGTEKNIWTMGWPLPIKEMLANRGSGSLDMPRKAEKDQQRMKSIAEVLSGGKM